MNKEINEIMLRRKSAIMLDALPDATIDLATVKIQDKEGILNSDLISDKTKREYLALTACKNMESLGFIVNKELYEKMAEDEKTTAKIVEYVIPQLESLKGADVKYNPMYKNFPKEVMEMSEFELYLNAITHYWSGGKLYPQSTEEKRENLNEDIKLIPLSVGTQNAIYDLFTNLLNSNTPWSEQDLDDITVLSKELDIKKAMPEYIVNHENMATLAKLLVEENGVKALLDMRNSVKGATDVLRIMNVIHGNGDSTLKNGKIKIKNMKRPDRKIYLELLNGCKNASKEMSQYIEQWTKIEHVLHPHDYKDNKKFSKALKAFENMRDEKTIYAEKEAAIKSGSFEEMAKFYRKKPGMLAGDLDRLLRSDNVSMLNKTAICELYRDVAKDISPKVLWEVHKHFLGREKEKETLGNRIINSFYKDGTVKLNIREDTRTPLPEGMCDKLVEITEASLMEIYKDKPPMGKVYIDPAIEGCKIPNETRTASKGVVPMTPGSRLPINENAKIARGFIWWTNTEKGNRVDIDLSADYYDKNMNRTGGIYYGNFGGERDVAVFSGDITDGGDFNDAGVAEFMDLDLNALKAKGIKYVGFSVRSFTGQPFSELSGHCSFGFMEREKMKDGQIFEPSTVKQKINLSQRATTSVPCLFDVDSREMIWIDAPGNIRSCSNIVNDPTKIQCIKAIDGDITNLTDVIKINALARGEIVDNPEEADITFGFDGDVKPTDIDYFSGNLLPKEVAPEYQIEEVEEDKENENVDKNEEEMVQLTFDDIM